MRQELDEINLKILKILAAQGCISNVALAKEIGVAPSAALNRVRKLEESELILSYHAKLNNDAIGADFLTFVMIRTNGQAFGGKIVESLNAIPNVLEVHQTAGDYCFLIKVRANGTKEFAELLNKKISTIKGVSGTKTTIALSTYKEEMSSL